MSLTAAGRAFTAANLAADTFNIKRENGVTLNPDTGQLVVSWQAIHSAVKGHAIRQSGQEVTAGETALQLSLYRIIVPWNIDGVLPEDVVDVVTSADGDLRGKSLVVEETQAGTHAIRRVLICRLNLE